MITRCHLAAGAGASVALLAAAGTALAQAPTASFQALTQGEAQPTVRTPAPKRLVLDASASTGVSGPIVSYTWSFGDGSPDLTTATPQTTKTFPRFGRYPVKLVVADAAGQTAEVTQPVLVRAPLTTAAPIGRTRARVTRVLGWGAATKLLGAGFDARRERPRNLVAPGGNLTACRPAETVITFLFTYAGIPRSRPVQLRVLLDGQPFSGANAFIGGTTPSGADSYAVSTRLRGARLPQGLYEVRVILGGKTLVSSYVNWSC